VYNHPSSPGVVTIARNSNHNLPPGTGIVFLNKRAFGTNHEYAVLFAKSANKYAPFVPDLPGCVATGKTRSAVEKNIREALPSISRVHAKTVNPSGLLLLNVNAIRAVGLMKWFPPLLLLAWIIAIALPDANGGLFALAVAWLAGAALSLKQTSR
jgi:hypothetical protein